MCVEKLSAPDLDEAVALAGLCFGLEWEEQARKELGQSLNNTSAYPNAVFGMRQDGHLIGLGAVLTSWFRDNTYALSWVCIHPAHRHQGLGRTMATHCLNEATNRVRRGQQSGVVLLSTEKNRFYQELGFKTVAAHDNDWKLMLKEIDIHAADRQQKEMAL
ncbi:MAG: GNAT family N-acetyltransferase [Proteobacteria bacterium]|nr:GNAT family N-acetyltransferase [Pseudomonadota bacterium]